MMAPFGKSYFFQQFLRSSPAVFFAPEFQRHHYIFQCRKRGYQAGNFEK
jgi:hypothetical protein